MVDRLTLGVGAFRFVSLCLMLYALLSVEHGHTLLTHCLDVRNKIVYVRFNSNSSISAPYFANEVVTPIRTCEQHYHVCRAGLRSCRVVKGSFARNFSQAGD